MVSKKPRPITTKEIVDDFKQEVQKGPWYRFISAHKLFFTTVLVIILLAVVSFVTAYRLSARNVTFMVNTKPQRLIEGQTYSNLLYTNKGVFKNTDSLIFFKFNSSDIYNEVQQGKQYTCKVAGWRIGFFSAYPDIISCDGLTL